MKSLLLLFTLFVSATSAIQCPCTCAPTIKPTFSPTELFVSPTNIKPSKIWNSALFDYERPNYSLCMIMQVVPGPKDSTITYNDWKGTTEQCFRECEYDYACQYAMYSNVLKQCIKSIKIHMIDSSREIDQYIANNWTVVKKKTAKSLYYNALCASQDTSSKECKNFPECAWNKGPRGYNQVHIYPQGYCGRIKCTRK